LLFFEFAKCATKAKLVGLMKKQILSLLVPVALAMATGCTPTSKNSIAGGHIAPAISDVDARLVPTNRVNGQSEVETIQILGFKFNKGVDENRVGCIGNRLPLGHDFSLNPIVYLFRSPADRQAALDGAYYNAIENGNCDGLVETKSTLKVTGFSILGIFGHGIATASVDAYGMNIAKGALPKSK
jgi:hypothetical protein